MPRFSNLELGESFDSELLRDAPLGSGGETRDERYYLAQAYEHYQKAQFDKALRLYSRALEFDPNLVEGWSGQARMLIEMGEYKEALLWADKALDIFPDHSELLASKAVAYVRNGNRKKALELSDAAMQMKYASVYSWLTRGEVMLATKGWNDEYCFLRAVAAAGRDWFTRLLIARIYYFYHEHARAVDYAHQAIALHPTSPLAWHVLASSLAELGMRSQSRKAYMEALKLDTHFMPAQMGLKNLDSTSLFSLVSSPFRWLFAPVRWLFH